MPNLASFSEKSVNFIKKQKSQFNYLVAARLTQISVDRNPDNRGSYTEFFFKQ